MIRYVWRFRASYDKQKAPEFKKNAQLWIVPLSCLPELGLLGFPKMNVDSKKEATKVIWFS